MAETIMTKVPRAWTHRIAVTTGIGTTVLRGTSSTSAKQAAKKTRSARLQKRHTSTRAQISDAEMSRLSTVATQPGTAELKGTNQLGFSGARGKKRSHSSTAAQ